MKTATTDLMINNEEILDSCCQDMPFRIAHMLGVLDEYEEWQAENEYAYVQGIYTSDVAVCELLAKNDLMINEDWLDMKTSILINTVVDKHKDDEEINFDKLIDDINYAYDDLLSYTFVRVLQNPEHYAEEHDTSDPVINVKFI